MDDLIDITLGDYIAKVFRLNRITRELGLEWLVFYEGGNVARSYF